MNFQSYNCSPHDAWKRSRHFPGEDSFRWNQLFRNINTAEEWEQLRRSVENR